MSNNYSSGFLSAKGRAIRGWVKNNFTPELPVKVSLYINDQLSQQTFSLPNEGYKFIIPNEVLQNSEEVWADVRICLEDGERKLPKFPVRLNTKIASEAYGEVTRIGRIISGWARNGLRPSKHLEIEMLCDGEVFAARECILYRSDLHQMGLEDGCYGFQIELPDQYFTKPKSEFQIRVVNNSVLKNGFFRSDDLRLLHFKQQENIFHNKNASFYNQKTAVIFTKSHIN